MTHLVHCCIDIEYNFTNMILCLILSLWLSNRLVEELNAAD